MRSSRPTRERVREAYLQTSLELNVDPARRKPAGSMIS